MKTTTRLSFMLFTDGQHKKCRPNVPSWLVSTGAALMVATVPCVANASDIIYTINQSIGAGNVVGTIETNGTLGPLQTSNIVSWNLTLNGVGATYTLTPAGSSLGVTGNDLIATATNLKFNFGGTDQGHFGVQANNPGVASGYHYVCENTNWYGCQPGASVVPGNYSDSSAQYATQNGLQIIGTANGGFTIFDPALLASVQALADARKAQMLLSQLESQILLGRNEQVSCGNCGGIGVTLGSAYVGPHGRYAFNNEWTLLGGAQIGQSSHNGAQVDRDIGISIAVQYDPANMGTSRPYAMAGVSYDDLKLTYNRSYPGVIGTTSAVGNTKGSNTSAFGQIGWVNRLTRCDEGAAYLELSRLWQKVKGYTEQSSDSLTATVPGSTDRMDVASVNVQYTHLFGNQIEANLNAGVNRAFNIKSGLEANIIGANYSTSQSNFNYYQLGGRVGVRMKKGLTLDLYLNSVYDQSQHDSTRHGGFSARWAL